MPAPEDTPDVSRSAVTGRFVSEEEAAASPDTTVSERLVRPARGGTPAPSVGRVVHYVSYGTPKGEFSSMCRAALITEVDEADRVGLAVLNPTGLFFHPIAHENGPCRYDDSLENGEHPAGGTWHWPERV